MRSTTTSPSLPLLHRCLRWRSLLRCVGLVLALTAAGPVGAAEDSSPDPAAAGVLTSFEQIWALPDAAQQQPHRVRLDYVVYYYDPLWKAMWGESGGVQSYLSLGNKVFSIRPGFRIRVEGVIVPARGMIVDEPSVTVLEEGLPLTPESTAGRIGEIDLFNKRFVEAEGLVDRQTTRDANHLEVDLVAEGRIVTAQVLLRSDDPVPQLVDATVKVKGVYFARSGSEGEPPRIEIWVQGADNLTVTGSVARDARFDRPVSVIPALETAPADQLVRLAGVVDGRQPGRSITLRNQSGLVIVQTPQTRAVGPGEAIEAIGYPALEGRQFVLRRGLFRVVEKVYTNIGELLQLADTDKKNRYRVRLEYLVYFADPAWKVLWGRCGSQDMYLSLGPTPVALKPGQRIRLEGFLRPAAGMVVEEPEVTILAEGETLEPLPTAGRVSETERFNVRYVSLEGLVDRQRVNDSTHAELTLVAEGRPVVVRLLMADTAHLPNLEGALVRLRGTYSATAAPAGGEPTIELWVHGAENLELLGSLARDPRFNLPLTAVENLAAAPLDGRVRLHGIVRGQQPGRSVTLRDRTGQVTVLTAQTQPLQLGEPVEAVGVPAADGNDWILREGVVRRAGQAPTVPTKGEVLRLAEQLRELSPEEAARGYPVKLTGIVTFSNSAADFIYIRDASGGVRVLRPAGQRGSSRIGARIEVTGVSIPGRFTPEVLASDFTSLATIELPEAKTVLLEQALTGIEEAEWISMTGFLRDVATEGPWSRLMLSTASGEFTAYAPANDRYKGLRGAVLRVRGVCAAETNNRRQLTGIRLWVPGQSSVQVEEAMPADPFSLEERPLASLRQFSSQAVFNRRVRISGTVNHAAAGIIHVQDGNESIAVLSRETGALPDPGDRIEAVGFPGRDGHRLVLRETVFRRAGRAEPLPPRELENPETLDLEHDGLLVRVAGRLLDVSHPEDGVRLLLETERTFFEARLDRPRNGVPSEWQAGSTLALTGVYLVRFDEYRQPKSLQILLRSPADVAVLKRAPWWTVRRVFTITGILAVGLVLAYGWVLFLRRQVRRQTGQIAEQIEKEKAARLEAALLRASKLESLGVLAGGIAHDFNNLLTAIMGNLSLAKLDERCAPETMECITESEKAALRARDLTQQLLTFAKGGGPIRQATMLADVVRETAAFALAGAKVGCEFDMAHDLWPADVDKGQIGQVVQNLVLNAKEAMPAGGVIRLELRNEEVGEGRPGLAPGRYLRLSVSDSGTGIAPEVQSRIFEPFFTTKRQGSGLGLAMVYSIVKKHQGNIEVESVVGSGTTMRVWLPAAAEAPAAPPDAAPPVRELRGRVLFMDDEPQIRSLALTILTRLGLQVTAVDDGSAAVIEYATALNRGEPYDLVLMDLTVPGGMGGAKAMEKLLQIDPKVRAIVSSGYSSDPVLANFRAYGFSGMVPKPYVAAEVARVVERALLEPRA